MTKPQKQKKPYHRHHKNQKNQKGNDKPKRKVLTDYVYYLGSSSQAADYEVTTKFIINYIKQNIDQHTTDIVKALTGLADTDIDQYKPTLKYSKLSNETDKKG